MHHSLRILRQVIIRMCTRTCFIADLFKSRYKSATLRSLQLSPNQSEFTSICKIPRLICGYNMSILR